MCRDDKTPFFIAALILLASPAAGQEPCNSRDVIIESLAKDYGEEVIWAGVNDAEGMVEVLGAPDGGTWSIILTRPDGWACLKASGEGWRPVDPEPEGTVL